MISQEYDVHSAQIIEPSLEAALERQSEMFKAFGDKNRQKILHLLRGGEKCVSDLLPHFDILQPTVSTHLLILEESGVLKVRREGRRRLYSIADHRIYDVLDSFYEDISKILGV